MASSDYDFNLTRNDIINAALRKIGEGAMGTSPSSTQTNEAADTLNVMVKSWQSRGVFLWKEAWQKIDMVSGTAEYVLATAFTDANVFNIRAAYMRDSGGNDEQVQIISQDEYGQICDKDQSAEPICLVFNRDLTPSVTLWPVPTSSDDDLYLLTEKRLKDFDSSSATPDFPANWMNALIYGLAAELADEYSVPLQERGYLRSLANQYFVLAKNKSNSERGTDNYLCPAY